MTKQQPAGKQNPWVMVLMFTVTFLLVQSMCNQGQKAPPVDPRTPAMFLGDVENPASGKPPPVPEVQGATFDATKGSIYWNSSKLYWNTLAQVNKLYLDTLKSQKDSEVAKLTEEAKKSPSAAVTLKQTEAKWDETLKVEGLRCEILEADAQYKYGLSRNDTNVIRNAFNVLAGSQRAMQGTPLWTQEFSVPATEVKPERFPWRQWSAHDLYETLVTDLSARNKQDLIYGVFPGYQIIDALVNLTGAQPGFSYAFAAFLLALIVRIIVAPLVQKQLMWGRKMQQLGPLVKEIRAQFTDKNNKVTNQAELQTRTMELYKEYGINPLAGCLPAGIQFPLFITVYQFMLRYQFAFRKGTFLWINPHTSAATHGFFAPTLGDRDYVLIVLYGITMVISTLLMPVSDPTQVKQQKLMGVGMGLLFTVMMFTGAFPTPAAFVLYWVFTNLLATAQSLRAYRLPLPPLEKVNTKPGGVFPMPPFSDPKANGKTNGAIQLPKSTGTPAKHKPKKRK